LAGFSISLEICDMINRKDSAERRANERLHVPKRVLAVLKPYYTRLGRIKDVSMGGLSFIYLDSEVPSTKTTELDIISEDGSLHLDKLPCKTISDSETTEELPNSSVNMRRSGLQFGKLTAHQKAKMKEFIDSYTINRPELID
jgi:hypothetical protein